MVFRPATAPSKQERFGTDPRVLVALALFLPAIFIVDLEVPRGFSAWVLYLIPVGLAAFSRLPTVPLVTALVASACMVTDFYFSANSDVPLDKATINRSTGFVALWFVAGIGYLFARTRQALHRRDWLQTAQASLATRLQGGQAVGPLARNTLDFIGDYLDAPVAVLYVTDGAQGLERRATRGILPEDAAPAFFRLGEGLVGRAGAERQILHVRDVATAYLQIASGLGSMQPRELVLVPMAIDDELQLVVELGFVRPVEADDLELLERLRGNIAASMRAALDRTRLQELLVQSQRQAEEMQAQQEELRAANEELETHSRALKESQERLEQQHTELEQSNERLEAQRDELARARADQETKAAELERVNRYKSEFLANMSHELRTPLNSSLILARLLADNRRGNLSEEQVKYAETIYSAGNDLLALINDVLDLAKIEAGKLDLRPAHVPVQSLLRDLEASFAPVAAEKGLQLRIDATAAPAALLTDRLRLEQVLRNLLSNACKFTEAGSVSLTLRDEPDGRVSFAVRDTGIGIAADQQDVIFEAFRQADGTTSRKFGGTGLGLSISRDLAQRLGGELLLESAPGRGSCFTLVLPRELGLGEEPMPAAAAPAPAPALPPAAIPEPAPAAKEKDDRGRLQPGDRAVLIIEDDPVFAAVLQELARELQFATLVANAADTGLELARKFRPNAVLLDVGLPDHSGLAVLDRLKRDPETRHIPVHVLSVEDHTREALSMGAVGYMLKPVQREMLVEAFRRLESQFTERLRTVLVVEDDPRQCESVRSLLATAGVQTVAATCVAEAMAALRAQRFDCMVMDLRLPDGTGFDLLEGMMGELEGGFPPVIVYTGQELGVQEEERLRRYSSSIIIKGARSPERLLDEVTLFLHQVETRLPAQLQRMLSEARSRDAILEGRRILVVEDDIRNVFALSSILEPQGAKVEIARNGVEALAHLAKNEAVDLVLMDVMMPEMDGLQAMRAIRARPNLAKLPIIALTAKAMPDDHARCLEAGANDYVAKPIDVEKLLSLIRVWMPRRERV